MKHICILLILVPWFAIATAQQPDEIIINGTKLPLNTNPLDSVIAEKDWQIPKEAEIWSSNWRGYVAQWEIIADKLVLNEAGYLLKGYDYDDPHRKSIVGSLFKTEPPLVAEWYSGALIVPDGEMISYVHMGYGSVYSHYQILRIKNGIVIEHLSFTDAQFSAYQQRKFQAFKETEQFQKEFNELVNGKEKWPEEDALAFLQSYYAEYYLSL